jgi:hypothetical protein
VWPTVVEYRIDSRGKTVVFVARLVNNPCETNDCNWVPHPRPFDNKSSPDRMPRNRSNKWDKNGGGNNNQLCLVVIRLPTRLRNRVWCPALDQFLVVASVCVSCESVEFPGPLDGFAKSNSRRQ